MQRSDTQSQPNLQTIKNPVQIAREELGFTQDLLAAVAECSRVLVMHVEQGLVGEVPKKLLKVLDTPGLEDRYKWWITDTRTKNYIYLEKGIEVFLNPACSGYGNWMNFRKNISKSKIGMCKLYCIHPQVLANFEHNWEERGAFTVGIKTVLMDSGAAVGVIANMEFAMLRRGRHD